MKPIPTSHPVYRNIHLADIATYRLPVAGIVSILHRVSGALMFLLLPFIVWLLDTSLSSNVTYDSFTSALAVGMSVAPSWFVKLVTLGLIWSFLHHFVAGLRHLWMDVSHKAVEKSYSHTSAVATLAISLLPTAVLGWKLFF